MRIWNPLITGNISEKKKGMAP